MKTKEFKAGQTAFIVYKERSHLPFTKRECIVEKAGSKYVYTDRYLSTKYEESVRGDKVNYLVNLSPLNFEEFLFKNEKEADAFIEIDYKKKRIVEAVSLRGLSEMSDNRIREIYDILTKSDVCDELVEQKAADEAYLKKEENVVYWDVIDDIAEKCICEILKQSNVPVDVQNIDLVGLIKETSGLIVSTLEDKFGADFNFIDCDY